MVAIGDGLFRMLMTPCLHVLCSRNPLSSRRTPVHDAIRSGRLPMAHSLWRDEIAAMSVRVLTLQRWGGGAVHHLLRLRSPTRCEHRVHRKLRRPRLLLPRLLLPRLLLRLPVWSRQGPRQHHIVHASCMWCQQRRVRSISARAKRCTAECEQHVLHARELGSG